MRSRFTPGVFFVFTIKTLQINARIIGVVWRKTLQQVRPGSTNYYILTAAPRERAPFWTWLIRGGSNCDVIGSRNVQSILVAANPTHLADVFAFYARRFFLRSRKTVPNWCRNDGPIRKKKPEPSFDKLFRSIELPRVQLKRTRFVFNE